MEAKVNNSSRRGQFLWMENSAQEKYVDQLKEKIKNGHYFSEQIITKIVEELAPVMADTVQCE